MQTERLLQLLRHPHQITPADVPQLKALVQQHPYFQPAHALLAKAAKQQNWPNAQQALETAAAYAPDRRHLKALLQNHPPFTPPPRGQKGVEVGLPH